MKRLLLLLLIVFVSGCTTGNAVKEGPYIVVNVVDGDTIDLASSERVRLSGINTPETGECYHKEAKERLAELVLYKEVYLEKDRTNKDKYGRMLRYIYLDDALVNSILVEEGYAKVYDKYKDDTKRYEELKESEAEAAEKNLGVWSCKDPKEECLYVASKNSKTYHTPDCKWAKKIKPENLICFKSKEEIPANMKPCKTCQQETKDPQQEQHG